MRWAAFLGSAVVRVCGASIHRASEPEERLDIAQRQRERTRPRTLSKTLEEKTPEGKTGPSLRQAAGTPPRTDPAGDRDRRDSEAPSDAYLGVQRRVRTKRQSCPVVSSGRRARASEKSGDASPALGR